MEGYNESLSAKELQRVVEDAGYRAALFERKNKHSSPLVKGRLSFGKLPSGFSLHCTDIIETRKGSSCTELPPCLSMTVLLNGAVDYALDNCVYHIEADNTPVLFVNTLSQHQVFTRYLKKGQRVRKVNISIDKNWLVDRCSSDKDMAALNQMFGEKHRVYKWQCSADMLALAEQLFTLQASRQLEDRILLEQRAFELFSKSFTLLRTKPLIAEKVKTCSASNIHRNSVYEQKIERIMEQDLSLDDIAKYLGTSVSTLQRYFKGKHHITVAEFIRNKKLECARRRILFENLSIGEAAYNAGYRHVSNFTTAFKKYFSITPAELKRQHQHAKMS